MMITVSIRQLVDSIKEADVYRLPDMNEGTGYLYNNLYKKLSKGMDVALSSLDMNAFEPEDLDSLSNLHTDVFERDCYAAGGIMHTLKSVAPVSRAVGYV